MRELYELSLHGGAAEERYRRACPGVEELPWDSLALGADVTDEERVAARREWTEASLQEYASAATFSLTVRALLRARVPIDLSAMVARFPVDEIAHAELCARVAGQLGGGTPLAYEAARLFPLPSPTAETEDPTMAAAARVVFEMCVRESWSHGILKALERWAGPPLFRALWQRILDDEAAHAGFGWLFLEWLDPDETQRERLGNVAARAIAELESSLDAVERGPARAYSRHGIIESIGRARYLEESRRAIAERVRKPLARFGLVA